MWFHSILLAGSHGVVLRVVAVHMEKKFQYKKEIDSIIRMLIEQISLRYNLLLLQGIN